METAVETNTGIPGERLPEHTAGPDSYSWWGMVFLIATEAVIFALLIAAYFYLRFKHGVEWPPGEIKKPKLGLVTIMTVILWSSSIPVHIADRAIRKGNQGMLRVGLGIGFLLGLAFILLQAVVEYPEVLHKEFTPMTNAYGSLYFALTGLHGTHVVVGLAMSLWTQVRAWRGAFDEHRHVTVQNFAMYWHFVDTVWLFVLATIYLSPHF